MTLHTEPELRLASRARLAPSSTIRDLLEVTQQVGMRSLAGGLPDPARFPLDRLRSAAARVLDERGGGATALQYGPTDGIAALRAQLARPSPLHGLTSALADEIVITSGSQQGIDLLCRALIDPGDEVAVDDPCYLGARQAFAAAGARLRGIPVDHDGLCVEQLERLLRAGLRPRLLYTVPNFHNPTGAVLAEGRRAVLARLASHYGFVVVEDDPYHALAFTGATHRAIGDLDGDHVVTLGSLSKALAPGLRIGWLRAPAWLREALVRAKQVCDLHTSSFAQCVVLDLLQDEMFLTSHLRDLQDNYATRAAALHAAIASTARVAPVAGGMFLWAELTGVDTQALLARALEHRVAFVPGAAFAVDRSWSTYLRLSFATLPPPELRVAAASLGEAIRQQKR